MASIRERTNSAGVTTYAVLHRIHDTQTSDTFDTWGQADRFRGLLNAVGAAEARERVTNAPAATIPTVAQAVEQHIAGLHSVTARTRADYRRDAARHITPHLGGLPIDELTAARAGQWAAARDVTDKTLRNLHGLLSAAVSTAVADRHIVANPIKGMRLPRRTEHLREEMVTLSPAQYQLVLSETPEHWRPLLAMLAGTGMRWGEAIALEVVDVDLGDTSVVRIVKSFRRTDSGYEIGPPKSARSRRTVSLPGSLVDVVAPLLDRPAHAPLFTARSGQPMGHRTFAARGWSLVVARAMDRELHGAAALPRRPRIHDFRHTHASWLIAAGVPLPVIQRRLGHESITTTIDRYGHLAPELHHAAADAADAALRPLPVSPA